MLVLLSTLSIMKFYLSDYKFHLACLVTFLVGWVHSSVNALSVWSMVTWGASRCTALLHISSTSFLFGVSTELPILVFGMDLFMELVSPFQFYNLSEMA